MLSPKRVMVEWLVLALLREGSVLFFAARKRGIRCFKSEAAKQADVQNTRFDNHIDGTQFCHEGDKGSALVNSGR
jgi:hypothetical protein